MSERLKKIIRKLDQKKYRKEFGLIKVEGKKLLQEAIDSEIEIDFILANKQAADEIDHDKITVVDDLVLSQLTSFKNHQGVIAALKFECPKVESESKITLILDGVSDPGNLGTIIRLADWYGITKIIGIPPFVDVFNPKTVQSSMGSIFRVQVNEMDFEEFVTYHKLSGNPSIYVADMKGKDFRNLDLSNQKAFLVMGSESHGPSGFWKEMNETNYITIPKNNGQRTESLNVAMATGIILERTLF
jgi:TrmH family RNA methyltransferase